MFAFQQWNCAKDDHVSQCNTITFNKICCLVQKREKPVSVSSTEHILSKESFNHSFTAKLDKQRSKITISKPCEDGTRCETALGKNRVLITVKNDMELKVWRTTTSQNDLARYKTRFVFVKVSLNRTFQNHTAQLIKGFKWLQSRKLKTKMVWEKMLVKGIFMFWQCLKDHYDQIYSTLLISQMHSGKYVSVKYTDWK